MPDYGIIKPLCQELGITVSELIDGEVKADSSIRVFDEEQILDMLGRIQQLEKTENVNSRYPADCNGNCFVCIFSVARRNGFQRFSVRFDDGNFCRRNARRSIYHSSILRKTVENHDCYAK